MDIRNLEEKFYYAGDDLGSTYQKNSTKFRVWAPTAEKVQIRLYQEGKGGEIMGTHQMVKEDNGTWYQKIEGDLNGVYYTYLVTVKGKTNEVVDIYAKACGVNGKRGMVIDLEKTAPEGWKEDKKPPFQQMTDAIIYEVHVRDISADETSGIKQTGKFLGLVEEGTKSPQEFSTGLDHMKELGVTHVHLLPVFDFCSVDEEHTEKPQYNWGYAPLNYNIPEGSYSTDPFHGEVRIKEFKEMVKVFHDHGLRVIMDVVYNHTCNSAEAYFEKTVPGYYYRVKDGKFTNGSGCGNETASEHKMMRKYMVDSVSYWAKEYHMDGFCFRWMAAHDLATMKQIKEVMKEIDPSILIYGEGWKKTDSTLKVKYSANKKNARKIPGIAMFSENACDSVRGHMLYHRQPGFVNGLAGVERKIQSILIGGGMYEGTRHIDRWTDNPGQSINYVSCHDGLTIWDKLSSTNPRATRDNRIAMNKIAAAIVFMAQGIPFMQAGEELLRTKPSLDPEKEFDDNSYCSPDSVNSIKWNQKSENIEVFEYYKGLIAFRKAHPALRMTDRQLIEEFFEFLEVDDLKVVSFLITKPFQEESAEYIWGIFNANTASVMLDPPELNKKREEPWIIYVDEKKSGIVPLRLFHEKKIMVPARSSIILCK